MPSRCAAPGEPFEKPSLLQASPGRPKRPTFLYKPVRWRGSLIEEVGMIYQLLVIRSESNLEKRRSAWQGKSRSILNLQEVSPCLFKLGVMGKGGHHGYPRISISRLRHSNILHNASLTIQYPNFFLIFPILRLIAASFNVKSYLTKCPATRPPQH